MNSSQQHKASTGHALHDDNFRVNPFPQGRKGAEGRLTLGLADPEIALWCLPQSRMPEPDFVDSQSIVLSKVRRPEQFVAYFLARNMVLVLCLTP